jgi:hypothetical protein
MASKFEPRELIAENKKLQKQLAQLKASAAEIVLKYQEAKNEIKRLKECVEFYADKKYDKSKDLDLLQKHDHIKGDSLFGGSFARKTLEKK